MSNSALTWDRVSVPPAAVLLSLDIPDLDRTNTVQRSPQYYRWLLYHVTHANPPSPTWQRTPGWADYRGSWGLGEPVLGSAPSFQQYPACTGCYRSFSFKSYHDDPAGFVILGGGPTKLHARGVIVYDYRVSASFSRFSQIRDTNRCVGSVRIPFVLAQCLSMHGETAVTSHVQ